MKKFRADLHIHTVLSPCADLYMGPKRIIKEALDKKLDIIGITDHNSTRNASVVKKLGEENGLRVLCGVELTTKEEVHCLAFFEKQDHLESFQQYIDLHLPRIMNNVNLFGYQLIVDEDEVLNLRFHY